VANRTTAVSRPQARKGKREVTDSLDVRLAAAQRGIVTGVVLLAGLAIWKPLPDPFMLPKVTAVVLGAVALLGLAGVRALRAGRVTLPAGPALWISSGFVVALVLATVTADNVLLALVGNHRRYGGLMSYLSYVVIFLVTVRLFATSSARPVVRALLAALAGVTAYGLLQLAGLDPVTWVTRRGDRTIFSTLGNTNFAGAYVALLLPVAATVALLSSWSRNARLTTGAGALVAAAYMLATAASQAVLASFAGLLVVGVAWALSARRRAGGGARPRPQWARPAAAAVAVVAVLAVGLLGLRVADDVADSYAERLQFWQAALTIAADQPLVGTGLDSFRDHFPQQRPAEHAVERGYQITDSTHNAVLGMLSNGGLLLALTYLAFVGYTGWTLLRGLRSVPAERLVPLAAFGGLWVAYQVQSMVSVDVPPLAFLHFLSAGLIVATVAPARTLSWRLPVAAARPSEAVPRPGERGRALTLVALVAVALLTLTALWGGLRPLRADLAASGARGVSAKQGVQAVERAVALAPWEAEYRILKAQAYGKIGNERETYRAASEAAELRRGSSKLAIGNADLAQKAGRPQEASAWVELALERDPHNPVLLEKAAEFYRDEGDAQRAAELERRAQDLRSRYGGR
jgi:putative inorganic carbon (HCO3(-)) transporter